MKKFFSIIISIITLVSVFATPTYALEETCEKSTNYTEIEYYKNGYFSVTIIDIQSKSTTYKTATKTRTVYSSEHEALCSLKLTAQFQIITGVSSTCTSASYNTTIYDSHWSIVSPSATKSGATATAIGTAKKKVLGILVQSIPLSVTMTCDKNGNIS